MEDRIQALEATVAALSERLDALEGNSGSTLPPDWKPSGKARVRLKQKGMTAAQIDEEAENFEAYWHTATGQKAIKKDWDRAFAVTWCNNAMKWHGKTKAPTAAEISERVRRMAACKTVDDMRQFGPMYRDADIHTLQRWWDQAKAAVNG